MAVDDLEFGSLLGESLLDVRRRENWLQVEPNALHLHEVLKELQGVVQPLLPLHNSGLEYLRERRALHGDGLHNLVVQNLLHFVHRPPADHLGPGVLPRFQLHGDRLPVLQHLVEDGFDGVLLGRSVGNLLQFVQVLLDVVAREPAEENVLFAADLDAHDLRDFGEVAVREARVSKTRGSGGWTAGIPSAPAPDPWRACAGPGAVFWNWKVSFIAVWNMTLDSFSMVSGFRLNTTFFWVQFETFARRSRTRCQRSS